MLTEDQEREILKYIDSLESTVYVGWWSRFCHTLEPLDLVNFKEHRNILNGLRYENNEHKIYNKEKTNNLPDRPTNLKPYKLVYHLDKSSPFGEYAVIHLISKDEISGEFYEYTIGTTQYIEVVKKHLSEYRVVEYQQLI